ncbi:aminotransferase class I/II-fold pyridoxal phosphate-dependent enzyme [Nocardioides pocheonensis]|uniref:Aminotransferase n=1 Tax=Nocardioides pocheonensis TaxID=661485 RepID=A0A3N0GI35_9ACTN|nr:aminotransferase class I/II-fold pyridoxal phosphate-dependent enzyme [Nocardioides pocheonensis]RNM12111.1 aminotransferase class I/II-fold pyridoxal phosphate-dependent enzyme [Nocardioides pocheonensis]
MAESDNPIFRIADRAAGLRASGFDVISLAAGEPEAPTATHIVEAAVTAARDPRTHHYGPAAGLADLRERVAAQHPDHVTADHVQITIGTKHALHLALGALAGPGEEVLVLRPSWPGHVGAVESVGASVVPVLVDRDGLTSVDALEAARTPRTRAVVVANPSNPSGVLHPAGLLAEIAAWCVDKDVWLVSDEVYGGLVFDADPFSATAVVADSSRLVVVDGVSKVHAMTGWRVGWLLGPTEVVAAARAQVSATITHVPSITQYAALAALTAPVDADTVADYRASRDLLVGKLAQVPGVECPTPAGGMFAFPDVSKLLSAEHPTAAELAAWLLDEAHVAVVSGEVFGDDGTLRISFALDQERLTEAADRLVSALTKAGS